MEAVTKSTVEAVCGVPETIPIEGGSSLETTINVFSNFPDLISPVLLNQLSGFSTALLVLIGLVASGVLIGFVYACSSLVVRGNKTSTDLERDQSNASLYERCDWFWTKAVIVADELPEKERKAREGTGLFAFRQKNKTRRVGGTGDSQPLTPKTVGPSSKPYI